MSAMDILKRIEEDVNNGAFDKELYHRDIAALKGQMEELSILRNTLGQLKEQIPQYAEHVDKMQLHIKDVESDVDKMVDSEVQRALRVNDNFNSLMDMINGREPSPLRNNKKLKKDTQVNHNSLDKNINPEELISDKPVIVRGVLLKELLGLVEKQWVTEVDFEKIPETMGAEDLSTKIFILTKVTSLMRSMPDDIFVNIDTKQNMLSAAQECLDSFVEEEAEDEMDGIVEVEQGYGVVGEVIADLGLSSTSGKENSG